MLESVLFLVSGILFIMLGLLFLNKKMDVLQDIFYSITIITVAYVVFSSLLIVFGLFSVNRCLMLLCGLSFMFAAISIFLNKKIKPEVTFDFKSQLLPVLVCLIFAVVCTGISVEGFYSIDTVVGASQAKAVNLASSNDISPLESEFILTLEPEVLEVVNDMNATLIEDYSGYNVVLTALLTLGAYFFGYGHMMAIFIVPGVCAIYLCYLLIHLFLKVDDKKRKLFEHIVTFVVAIIFVALIPNKFTAKENIVLQAEVISDFDSIISSYDMVVLDEDIKKDLYIPFACVTKSKVYPQFADLKEVFEVLQSKGERLYFITDKKVNMKDYEDEGLYLKNVYEKDNYRIYRALNFYKSHENFDYTRVRIGIYLAMLLMIAIIFATLIYSMIFDYLDNAINIVLSTCTALAVYGMAAWIMMLLEIYAVVYTAAVTMTILCTIAVVMYMLGGKPKYRYDAYKSIGIVIGIIIAVTIAKNMISGDFYANYRTLGSSQLWALKYMNESHISIDEVKRIPFIIAQMCVFGSLFGYSNMIMFIPVGIVGIVSIVLAFIERICKKFRTKAIFHIVLNIILLVGIVFGMKIMVDDIKSKEIVARWSDIEKYADKIEPDDSLAIEEKLYDIYYVPLKVLTGVRKVVDCENYESAEKYLDGFGKHAYYLSREDLDPTYTRVNIEVHDNGLFLYRGYQYLTNRGIYSVEDSVVQGFYPSDLSGMSWTSDENAFIQCYVPYKKYDTLRLYLGDYIKFDKMGIESFDIEFRENWYKVDLKNLNKDNNGQYIDFKLDWSHLVEGNNVFYFHSMIMWSPLIYGDKDTRIMGFPFKYVQFLKLEEDEEIVGE